MYRIIQKYCLCLLILSPIFGFGQVTYFNKTYDSLLLQTGGTVLPIDTSGYLAIGNSLATNARYLYFVRTNKFGDTIWTKMFGQLQRAYFYADRSIIKTNDGKYAFAGSISLDTINGDLDSCLVMLFKLDLNGDTLWTKKYGDYGKSNYARNCFYTSDNGYAICGWTNGFVGSDYKMYLIKTDSTGNLQWQKTYGGGNYEDAQSVEQTSDGGYILAGNTLSYGAGQRDIYVVKTDANGNQQWQKTFGTSNDDNGFACIHQLSTGEYILTGGLDFDPSNNYQFDAYIAKLDISGNIIWDTTYGTINKYELFDSEAVESIDGGYIVIGAKQIDSTSATFAWIVKFSSTGAPLWERMYSKWGGINQNYFYDVKSTLDGGFIFCGQASNFPNGVDLWLVKTDSLGCDSIGCSPTGIFDYVTYDFDFIIYPNPSSGIFTIDSPKEISQIEIYDVLAKIIYNQQFSKSSNFQIDLSSQPKGIYFAKVLSEGRIYTQKIIIQ